MLNLEILELTCLLQSNERIFLIPGQNNLENEIIGEAMSKQTIDTADVPVLIDLRQGHMLISQQAQESPFPISQTAPR